MPARPAFPRWSGSRPHLGDIAFLKLVGKLAYRRSWEKGRPRPECHELLVSLPVVVRGKQLVHGSGVILAGLAHADALVLQAGQRAARPPEIDAGAKS